MCKQNKNIAQSENEERRMNDFTLARTLNANFMPHIDVQLYIFTTFAMSDTCSASFMLKELYGSPEETRKLFPEETRKLFGNLQKKFIMYSLSHYFDNRSLGINFVRASL